MDDKVGDGKAPRLRLPVVDASDEDQPQPEVARIRRKVSSAGADGRVRSKTIAPKRLTREEKRLSETLVYPEDVVRPKTRAECTEGERPCPFVSCKHHLYLDVSARTGAIKLNFPDLEVWEMTETCALDVADRGGTTLEEVGAIMNLTRERIRQVEVKGLAKLQALKDMAALRDYVDEGPIGKRRLPVLAKDDDEDEEGGSGDDDGDDEDFDVDEFASDALSE